MRYPALEDLAARPRHVVAICGAAVSGSEAAAICAANGIAAIVFEQNARPYGKIEDGLPRWHDKLRAKECDAIDDNLRRAGVYFVPHTRLGRDLPFDMVARRWGLSAVLLASGAWRDRPLPVPGADAYVGKGLVYQNAFVHWFNHHDEPDYDGPHHAIADAAVVIGGGLASVDVAKIINLELYRTALRRRGLEVDVVEMEHAGITATLRKHGLDPAALGVAGCTLYYRRRVCDMPLAFPKDDATPEQIAKTERVREKMVGILQDKYRVRVEACQVPVATLVEDGRLVGLTFRRTEVAHGRAREVPGSDVDVRSALIVSSIGSVPEPIEGIPTCGDLYDFSSQETGALAGLPGVFGLGNVLTGKGNIKSSRENARGVSAHVLHEHLGLGEQRGVESFGDDRRHVRTRADGLATQTLQCAMVPCETLRTVADVLANRWKAVGYDGDYGAWIERQRPPGASDDAG